MKNSAWLITAKTNIHVGDENTSNYGIIDKSVQKDVLTGLPCIHSSSLKGALSEYFESRIQNETERIEFIKKVFGEDKTKRDDSKHIIPQSQKGDHIFFDAHLLLLPVQSNVHLFYLATCPAVLKRFLERLELLDCKSGLNIGNMSIPEKNKPWIYDQKNPVELGEYCAKNNNVKPDIVKSLEVMTGQKIALFNDEDFKELCHDDNLPIIARNYLKNGTSSNLWYEQVLPAETVFYTFISTRNDEEVEKMLNIIDPNSDVEKSKECSKENGYNVVQIGANATIGYGYCEFKEIKA